MSKKNISKDNFFEDEYEDEEVTFKAIVKAPKRSQTSIISNPENKKDKQPRNSTGFPVGIIIAVVVVLGLIFAILQISYYVYAVVFISTEGNFRIFAIDVDQFTDFRLKQNYDEESTRSYLIDLIIVSIFVNVLYIIDHCVLIVGAVNDNIWICIGWCIGIGICIFIRIIIILCAPLVMFQYLAIEMIFEILGIGFVLLFLLEVRKYRLKDLYKDPNKVSPTPTEIFDEFSRTHPKKPRVPHRSSIDSTIEIEGQTLENQKSNSVFGFSLGGWNPFRSKPTPLPAITDGPTDDDDAENPIIPTDSKTQIVHQPIKKGRRRPSTTGKSLWRKLLD